MTNLVVTQYRWFHAGGLSDQWAWEVGFNRSFAQDEKAEVIRLAKDFVFRAANLSEEEKECLCCDFLIGNSGISLHCHHRNSRLK